MRKSRVGALGALVVTLAFTVACFVGPACGCGSNESEASDTVIDDFEEAEPALTGAQDVALASCEPRSWDIEAPAEVERLLTLHVTAAFDAPGEIVVTVESAGEYTYEWGSAYDPPIIEVAVPAGEPIAVHFAADVEVALSWTFSLTDVHESDGHFVTEFDDPAAPVPATCE